MKAIPAAAIPSSATALRMSMKFWTVKNFSETNAPDTTRMIAMA